MTNASADGAGTPTGAVQFDIDGAAYGAPVPLVDGVATIGAASLGVGPHTVTATYMPADGDFLATTSASLTESVAADSTATTVSSSASSSVFGQSVTFTATVSVTGPGAGTPTGTVTFYDGTAPLGTGTLSTTGGVTTATLSTAALTPGSQAITAVYGGDADDVGSTSAALSQGVARADTTITLGVASPVVVAGQTDTLTLSLGVVPPGAPIAPATGTVTIYDTFDGTTTTLATFTIGQSGSFPALTAVGTHVLTAVYSGDNDYNGSTSAPITVQVVAGS